MARPVRIGNISGFYGDRPGAAAEMLAGGPIDVLSGDWLAELAMAILARNRAKRSDGGYAATFVAEMAGTLDEILRRGVKVVANAGGLDPLGCAEAVRALGTGARVAAVTGDDLAPRWDELRAAGLPFPNLDTGARFTGPVLTANAYLGGWGIAAALQAGADVVVTGRVSDASLVVGPAAWWHRWERDDWDALAGAVVAGHLIECGTQATGGNYSLFTAVAGMTRLAFPWVEVAEDGSSVAGKHHHPGGEVSLGTVTSQLLYEIDGPRYLNPDVVARFDTIRLEETAADRVAIRGVRGEPPPAELKVAVTQPGGFANAMMVGLTGLDRAAKAELVTRQVWDMCPWAPDDYEQVRATVIGPEPDDPADNAEAITFLRLAVRDQDPERVGRAWSNTVAQIALGSIPGLFALWPPRDGQPIARYWPTTVGRELVTETVHLDDATWVVPGDTSPTEAGWSLPDPPPPPREEDGDTTRVPLGGLIGARSGDKGGNANLGVFTRHGDAYPWLHHFLTVDRLVALLPDLAGHRIDRYAFPNLSALNFVVHGLLDEGVASTLRVDPQAKGLGEYLRARHVDVPTRLLP